MRESSAARRAGTWLWLATGLFAVRVIAQPTALLVRFLPPFEAWHSAALPYPVLLATQLVLLGVMSWTSWRVSQGAVTLRPRLGRLGMSRPLLKLGGGSGEILRDVRL